MKIGIYSKKDDGGGAARSAYRLFKGLKVNTDKHVEMIVGNKIYDNKGLISPNNKIDKLNVTVCEKIQGLQEKLIKRDNHSLISSSTIGTRYAQKNYNKYDILNIHWINNGFLSLNSLKNIKKPIVFTLHDSWIFTGGCHVPFECDRFKNECGNCPRLKYKRKNDFTKKQIKNKNKVFNKNKFIFVTPSNWLKNQALKSSLLKDSEIHVIPNGLEIDRYKNIDKKIARSILSLNPNKKYILFGAVSATSNINKGFYLLKEAIEILYEQIKDEKDNVEILIFGTDDNSIEKDFKFNVKVLGKIYDDMSLNIIYSAADLFVLPSLSENLPNTVLEAMASGTPSIAFNQGGVPDLIEHMKNGYLVKPYDVQELASGIEKLIKSEQTLTKMSEYCRYKFEKKFTMETVSRMYIELFKDIIERGGNNC